MSRRRNYRELRERIRSDPKRRKRIEEFGKAYDVLLRLAELRESRGTTQVQVAESLGVSQPNVSKLEHQDDLYLSTLSNYVAALGGHLELKAVFPDQTVRLTTPSSRGREGDEPEEGRLVTEAAERFANAVKDSYHVVANRPISSEQPSAELTQNFFDSVINNLRTQTESNRQMSDDLANQQRRQQEATQALTQESVNAYMDFVNSMFSYYLGNTKQVRRRAGRTGQ